MRARATLLAIMLAAAAGSALGSPASLLAGPTRITASSCHAISAAKIPFAALEASYRRLTGLAPKTPLSKTRPLRYAECGRTHYAFALLVVARGVKLTYRQQVAQQDHSPVWVQRADGDWVDEGLDNPCRLAPAALINLWYVGAHCT